MEYIMGAQLFYMAYTMVHPMKYTMEQTAGPHLFHGVHHGAPWFFMGHTMGYHEWCHGTYHGRSDYVLYITRIHFSWMPHVHQPSRRTLCHKYHQYQYGMQQAAEQYHNLLLRDAMNRLQQPGFFFIKFLPLTVMLRSWVSHNTRHNTRAVFIIRSPLQLHVSHPNVST